MGKNARGRGGKSYGQHTKKIKDTHHNPQKKFNRDRKGYENQEASRSRSQNRKNFVSKNNKNKEKFNPKNKSQDLNMGFANSKKKKQLIDPMNPLKSLKKLSGNSAFKIVPEGMGDDDSEDKFAALGGSDEEEQQYDEDNEQQIQEEYQEGEEEYEDGDEQDEEQGEEDEEMEEEQDLQGQQYDEYGPGEYGSEVDDENERDGEVQNDEEQLEDEGVKEQEDEEGEGIKLEEEDEDKNLDISVINLKIQETLSVLMNVAKLGQGRSRKYFVEKLKKYIHQYYGYNFQLIDHFLNFLNPTEMIQLFEANETQRPLTIRTNTLKTRRKDLAQALIQRGVNLDPLADWSKDGIKIYDTKVPIGATPQYLAGHYMLQSASSFLPVLALDPQMNEKILDMAAAPGGKTSYIAQLMRNTGCVFANDLKKQRLRALQFNLHRMGITNTIVTCRDGRKYSKIFPNTFDRVLLDSPCTGLGIISKDMSIKANRVLIDIYKNSHIQKQLILSAIDSTKVGGVIVYSTCSVSPLENEEIVNFALKKRYVKVVDVDELVEVGQMGLTKFIDKRYHSDLRKTRRIYPHVHNMDGFYFAKLVKLSNGKRVEKETEKLQQGE